jgi:hypothetical protein
MKGRTEGRKIEGKMEGSKRRKEGSKRRKEGRTW